MATLEHLFPGHRIQTIYVALAEVFGPVRSTRRSAGLSAEYHVDAIQDLGQLSWCELADAFREGLAIQ